MTRWLELASGLLKLLNRALDYRKQKKLADDKENIRRDPLAAFDNEFGGVREFDRDAGLHSDQADTEQKARP